MSAYVYITDKRTNITYGPYNESTMPHLDELICRELGYEVDPRKYVGGWMDWFGKCVACNVHPSEVKSDFDEMVRENREAGFTEIADIQQRIWDHLNEHFEAYNNWSKKESFWRPAQARKKVKATA